MKATAPYRIMLAPAIKGYSKIWETLGAEKLDDEEIAGGEMAWGALLYQYGGEIDAKIMVTLWCAATAIPRIPQAIDYWTNRKKRKAMEAYETPQQEMAKAA